MSSQSVRVMCPNLNCRKVLAVPDSARGKTVRCKSCGTAVRIPDNKPAQPPAK
jgi:ribosomal protein S27E